MTSKWIQQLLLFSLLTIIACEKSYLSYVKDGCFQRGEALSCMKYKALKLATKTVFGNVKSNETIRATNTVTFVSLDPELVKNSELKQEFSEPRGFMSEWSALTNYILRIVDEFMSQKGLRVELPEGSKTEEVDGRDSGEVEGRGKRKKLAVILPLLSLLATIKTKILLIPILLSVLFIKKLLLVAALLIPSLLSTLKACKMPHPPHHYSHFGVSDSASEFSSYGGGGGYAYSNGGAPPGYGKDWAANRAYALPKRPPPSYATAPGSAE